MASSMSFNALKLAPLVVAVLLLTIGASHAFTKTAARPNSQTSPQQRGISLAPKSANSDVAEEGMVVEEITSVSQFNTILTGIETYPYPKKSYTQENFKRKMQGLPPLEEEIPEGVKIDQEVILKVGAGFCPACRYVGPRFHKLAAVHGGGGGGGGGGGEEEEEEEEPRSACAAIPAAAAADDDGCEEMSMREILEGKDCYFPGLIPLCQAYLDHIGCDRDTRGKVERYLDLIRARGRGELPTAAAWARAFVARHPEYARDSVVGEGVAYDLLRRCRDVAEGRAPAPELLGAAEVKPIYPEGAFEIPLSAARIDRGERCVLIQRYLHRAQERQRRATLEVDELLKASSPRAAAAAQGHTEMAAAVAAAAAPSPDDAGGVAGPHRCGCCGEEAGCCGCPVAEEEAVPPAVALARMRSISLAATESLMGHDLFPVAPPAASSDSPSLLPVQPPPGDGRRV
eukprot:CAMPEP_0194587672 /NCGR_PEP_ID=MMETSP0292-20121207/19296_1 /TAXON_ID=39354 /ORGANISM="Heterosigma akashiwo, Strain CCMP2393" /LENGTH=457 /DNA_ID=CAMNT_0039443973 /DNA_START=39 /DNA_END=1412 /DNA_ORIENTATION=+